jgi:hypothetical protein
MRYDRSRNLVCLSLLAASALGGLVILFSFVGVPAYQASSVDAILAPDELRDRKLIEVVYRTHRHNAARQERLFAPYRVLGVLTVMSATGGLIALRGISRPLVPRVIGTQVEESH